MKTQETENTSMKPIWYFVGWLLLIVGLIVFASGIYGVFFPPATEARTVLYGLHAGVWWGAVVAVVGGIFLQANRNSSG